MNLIDLYCFRLSGSLTDQAAHQNLSEICVVIGEHLGALSIVLVQQSEAQWLLDRPGCEAELE